MSEIKGFREKLKDLAVALSAVSSDIDVVSRDERRHGSKRAELVAEIESLKEQRNKEADALKQLKAESASLSLEIAKSKESHDAAVKKIHDEANRDRKEASELLAKARKAEAEVERKGEELEKAKRAFDEKTRKIAQLVA